MLGLTSYQESLRSVGSILGQVDSVSVVEHTTDGLVELTTAEGMRQLGIAELREIILTSHARRGEHRPAGSVSDLLRAVGRALDELHARDVFVQLAADRLAVHFRDEQAAPHELAYAGQELDALRRAAADRRNGRPLRRVLVLQDGGSSSSRVVEPLIVEFAVQALPTLYAPAVAAAAEPPDLILAQGGPDLSETIAATKLIRAGQRTCDIPIVVVAAADTPVDSLRAAFAAGADDVLSDPPLPALLRARLRTWLLRKRVGG